MSFLKSLTGCMAVFLQIILMPSQAQACSCAQKPDGGYICEEHCAPDEINTLTGPGHDSASGCYISATGDYVCLQNNSSVPPQSDIAVRAGGSTVTSGQDAAHRKSDTPDAGQDSISPRSLLDTPESAYQWPPGFSCEAGSDSIERSPDHVDAKAEAEETFDGALSSLGDTLLNARHVELARGKGVNGSDAIKVNYVGSSQGSDRVTARYALAPSLEYTLNFDVNFCDGFDFVKGGKLHGLGPANPITGGNAVPDEGWSARGMFRPNGRVQSYVYSQNMKGQYGEGVLSNAFSFRPGQYYSVSYQVGLNNPASASNGYMRVFIDGTELISHQNIKFRDSDDPKSLISTLLFNTFHGGHKSEWAPKNADGSYATECAYYDNFAAYASPQVRMAAEENVCVPGNNSMELASSGTNSAIN